MIPGWVFPTAWPEVIKYKLDIFYLEVNGLEAVPQCWVLRVSPAGVHHREIHVK